MHTPLNPHLHTEECNKVIRKLLDCHSQNSKLIQIFGICNDLDREMRRCTKAERISRQKQNQQKAEERQARVRERFKQAKGKTWKELIDEDVKKQ